MATRACILCYHAVQDDASPREPSNLVVSTEQFRAQMRFLARRKRVVDLAALLEGDVPGDRPAVAITFDDGYRSVLTNAKPILEEHGFPATVFAATNWMGLMNQWDGATYQWDTSIMTADELRDLESGGISIESHGHAHVDLSQLTSSEVRRDLQSSVEVLTDVLGRAPRYVAYPFGRSSPAVRDVVAEMRFAAAFTVYPNDPEGPHEYDRVMVLSRDSMSLFALKASGRYLDLRRSRIGRAIGAVKRGVLRQR